MEMMKGMGAKQRFKAAMKAGKMDVARTAAAVMVQGAYRSKLARRRMLVQKAHKEKLRMEGYAKKIQCRYRARLARKRMEKIKAEKLAIKMKLMAMKVQVKHMLNRMTVLSFNLALSVVRLENSHCPKEIPRQTSRQATS
jgi:hypothetical protein